MKSHEKFALHGKLSEFLDSLDASVCTHQARQEVADVLDASDSDVDGHGNVR
jgi:hypothetical protein